MTDHLRISLALKSCPECERQLLSFETQRAKGDDWEIINELSSAHVYPGKKDRVGAGSPRRVRRVSRCPEDAEPSDRPGLTVKS